MSATTRRSVLLATPHCIARTGLTSVSSALADRGAAQRGILSLGRLVSGATEVLTHDPASSPTRGRVAKEVRVRIEDYRPNLHATDRGFCAGALNFDDVHCCKGRA